MNKVLKSAGSFGIVEHRAKAGMDFCTEYMDQAEVITDHPQGGWTLPPRLKLGDLDENNYLAIGDSARMTLKFTKK